MVYDEKYIIDLVARRDGQQQVWVLHNDFHDFGSVFGGWIFQPENFNLESHLISSSFGKIRPSYGTTGACDQIGAIIPQHVFGKRLS